MEKLVALGYAWIDNKRRPFYSAREIRRGESKGKIEVRVRARGNIFRLFKLDHSSLCYFKETDHVEQN